MMKQQQEQTKQTNKTNTTNGTEEIATTITARTTDNQKTTPRS